MHSWSLALAPYPDGMFAVIELLVKLLILPFKLIWEVVELLAHSNHRQRRRHPSRPAPQYSPPYARVQRSGEYETTKDDWIKGGILAAVILVVCIVVFIASCNANS